MTATCVVLIAMTSTGCALSAKPPTADLTLPEMTAEQRRECAQPALREGMDARNALADALLLLAKCRRGKAGLVRFYDSVKREFDTGAE